MSRRDNYDVCSTVEVEPHSSIEFDNSISNSNEDSYWARDGIEVVFVDEAYATTEGVETYDEIMNNNPKGYIAGHFPKNHEIWGYANCICSFVLISINSNFLLLLDTISANGSRMSLSVWNSLF